MATKIFVNIGSGDSMVLIKEQSIVWTKVVFELLMA